MPWSDMKVLTSYLMLWRSPKYTNHHLSIYLYIFIVPSNITSGYILPQLPPDPELLILDTKWPCCWRTSALCMMHAPAEFLWWRLWSSPQWVSWGNSGRMLHRTFIFPSLTFKNEKVKHHKHDLKQEVDALATPGYKSTKQQHASNQPCRIFLDMAMRPAFLLVKQNMISI